MSSYIVVFSGQNIANMGLMYLCDSMGGENNKIPDILMQVCILFEEKHMYAHSSYD